MRRVISTLLAGAAIIALSGCSDDAVNEIQEVNVEELDTGYEILFEQTAGDEGGGIEVAGDDQLPKDYVFQFCSDNPSDDLASGNIEVQADLEGYYIKRTAEEGYYRNAGYFDIIHQEVTEDIRLYDGDGDIKTHGTLEVGETYILTSGFLLEVKSIKNIDDCDPIER